MRKITLLVFGLIAMTSIAQIANTTGLLGADLMFSEDLRYYRVRPAQTSVSGFVATHTTIGAAATTGNSSIPADGTAAGQIGYTRLATNYPAADPAVRKSVKMVSHTASANEAADVWFVTNSIDLSGYDAGSKFFTFSSRTTFWGNDAETIDTASKVYYTTGFTQDYDPADVAVTWTELTTLTPVGASAAHGTKDVWTTQSIDLSAITCGTSFAIAIRRQTTANGPNGSGTFHTGNNRNGVWNLSDIVYTGSTVTLSLEDDVLSKSVSVYSNPATDVVNIRHCN